MTLVETVPIRFRLTWYVGRDTEGYGKNHASWGQAQTRRRFCGVCLMTYVAYVW